MQRGDKMTAFQTGAYQAGTFQIAPAVSPQTKPETSCDRAASVCNLPDLLKWAQTWDNNADDSEITLIISLFLMLEGSADG